VFLRNFISALWILSLSFFLITHVSLAYINVGTEILSLVISLHLNYALREVGGGRERDEAKGKACRNESVTSFSAIYATRITITVFTRVRHWFLSWAR
jgi:hypothetical protein